MKQNYVDLEVFNKRNGTTGTVVSQDETTISIKCGDTIKAVRESTFLRWYTIVPQDKPAEGLERESRRQEDRKERGKKGRRR